MFSKAKDKSKSHETTAQPDATPLAETAPAQTDDKTPAPASQPVASEAPAAAEPPKPSPEALELAAEKSLSRFWEPLAGQDQVGVRTSHDNH